MDRALTAKEPFTSRSRSGLYKEYKQFILLAVFNVKATLNLSKSLRQRIVKLVKSKSQGKLQNS